MHNNFSKITLTGLAMITLFSGNVNAKSCHHNEHHCISSVSIKTKSKSSSKAKLSKSQQCNEDMQKLYYYLSNNTKLNHNSVIGVCAVVLQQTGMDVHFHKHGLYGFLCWKNKPVPMNGNKKMNQLSQQELYLKDTINPKLVNELNKQKDAASAAKVFAKEYCHLTQKVNWAKYANQVNKEYCE